MPRPFLVTHHKDLPTLNSNESPLYRDAVPGIPGVDVQPLMLDTHN
jgi:2,4'-dihydroxyacetophenone dioxygenase